MRIQNDNYQSMKRQGNDKTIKETFSKEVGKFEEKVKDRLENGEVTYTMGMTSMTENDWENLMKNIDCHMKKVKELNEANRDRVKEKISEKDVYEKIMILTKEKI